MCAIRQRTRSIYSDSPLLSKTTFDTLANRFIIEQHSRANSDETIKHYEQSIRRLSLFLAYKTVGEETYLKMPQNEAIEAGKRVFCTIFDKEGLEADYRFFLRSVFSNKEQTIYTYFRDYRVLMYYAMDNKYIRPRKIKIRKVDTGVKDVYTDEEIDKLLKKPAANCSFTEYRNWVVVNYLLATGNRVGTIVYLRIKDVDLVDYMIMLTTQKNKKVTRIPIEKKHLAAILRDYIDQWLTDENGNYLSEYLFPSSYIENTNPMTRIGMGRAIAAYNRSRGVNKTSIHLFRHTFVKNWILSGGDLHSLQKILGHSTLNMVVHYANLYDKDLCDKVDTYSTLSMHNTKDYSHVHRKKHT